MFQIIIGRTALSGLRLKNHFIGLKSGLLLSLTGALVGVFLLPQTAYLSVITPEKIIELTNAERQANGLEALSANERLAEAAAAKARAILEAQTFSHTLNDKRFSSWVREVDYDYAYVGENLAIDFITSEGVMAAWNYSSPHKKNLLSPYYREVGLAAVKGEFLGQETTVVVQIFGAPSASALKETSPVGLAPFHPRPLQEIFNLRPAVFGRSENNLIFSTPFQPARLTPAENNSLFYQANNFFARPLYYPSLNLPSLTFALLSLGYLIIFLYFYRFYKFGRLIPFK